MTGPASSSLFMSLGNIWRLLALRSDVDDIILELLGHFSLEKIYADGDKESYQHLVITLLAQLNAIFQIQRLTLPSENSQVGWYLGFLASWEVTLRSVEFVLQVVLEGRESLWEAQTLRDKYLAELLLSALRLLILHPKPPSNLRAKDRRERFARVHRSLERIFDGYPGPKSFQLLVCKEITDVLRTDSYALQLPARLRHDLPNLATEMYPLNDCLTSKYISTMIPQDGFSNEWLSQFLALRDISQFIVGASIQYKVNLETKDVQLQASSAKSRNAVLQSLEGLRMPSYLSRSDLISTFSEMFRVILPGTPSLVRRSSSDSLHDESEMDAIDALCVRLTDRQVIHRVSDNEMMRGMSEIAKRVTLLDDPSASAQYRAPQPKLWVLNCGSCHLVGDSQLRQLEHLNYIGINDSLDVNLAPNSTCYLCGEPVSVMREITLVRDVWDVLKPLESNADTVNVERHLPNRFTLAPPKSDNIFTTPAYSNILSNASQRPSDADAISPQHQRSVFQGSSSEDRTRSLSQSLLTPASPGFRPRLDTPKTEFSSDNLTSSDSATYFDNHRPSDVFPHSSEVPYSPDTVGGRHGFPSRTERSTSSVAFKAVQVLGSKTVPLILPPPDNRKTGWISRLSRSKKETFKPSADTSSLSSTTLESQRLEEVSLKSLTTVSKPARGGKPGRNMISVYLSQNSTHALFWTPPLILLMDIGASPPTTIRAVDTGSTCVLAAVTKIHLAYIIGTRDQKLTLRIVNLVQPSVPVIDYRMSASPWCKSISICPRENYVVVGFENSLVRFFKTTNSDPPRDDRMHPHHDDCKECPSVDTLSFSNDGLVLLAGTRNPKSGTIQIYAWRFPFMSFQELSTCRYRVPLHESEDNGITSSIFRSGSGPGGDENLICITTWTQSGLPMLIQPEDNHRTEIKADISSRQGRLGSRIQCAAFSPSGKELAMVNEKGHLYQIASLNSSPMDIRRVATSKELTAKSESFAMTYMALPDEEAIILAWADSAKAVGFVKKIPLRYDGDAGVPPTPIVHSAISRGSHSHVELDAESNQIRLPAELNSPLEGTVGTASSNEIDHLISDIKDKLDFQ